MHKQDQACRKLHAAKQMLNSNQKDNESAEMGCSALQTELSHLAKLSIRLSERITKLQGCLLHEEAAAESSMVSSGLACEDKKQMADVL